jgi:hypothetical protein
MALLAGYWEEEHGEEEAREREREEKEGGGVSWRRWGLQEVTSVARAASRRWRGRRPGASHATA